MATIMALKAVTLVGRYAPLLGRPGSGSQLASSRNSKSRLNVTEAAATIAATTMSSRCSAESPFSTRMARVTTSTGEKCWPASSLPYSVEKIAPRQGQHVGEIMRVHPLQKPLLSERPAGGILSDGRAELAGCHDV